MKTRRKTAKAALLCLFCALLMAALPVTALAETGSGDCNTTICGDKIACVITGVNEGYTVNENDIVVNAR